MSLSPTLAGVVVTFHPDAEFEARCAIIAREVSPLVVVDNTAEPGVQSRLRAACAGHGAQLIANPHNRGLAAALNQAFALLAERGLKHVVAFDQDSTPQPGFAAALLDAAVTHPNCAVAGANWYDEGRPDFAPRHLRPNRHLPLFFERLAVTSVPAKVTCVITSGSLFTLATWRSLGGFDEGLFLDLVDTDYCLRARAVGGETMIVPTARLAHRRGAKRPVRFLGRTWWPAFMPPLRLRYLFRNRLRLFARHGWRAPHWVAFELIYTVKIAAEILFLEDRKGAKFSACVRGFWDGIRGAKGRIRSP